jgi:Kef-type K+ transport system membrane component KefB
MKLLLAIAVIAVVALIGSRLSFYRRRIPLGFTTMLSAGTEYIFIGVLLGAAGFEVIDEAALATLKPAIFFALGWIGFLVGLQFNVKELRKLPHLYFSITAVEALVTFALVATIAAMVLRYLSDASWPVCLTAALALGSTGCVTSPTPLAIVAHSHKLSNVELVGLLRYISGVDGLFSVVFLAIALSIVPFVYGVSTAWYAPLHWLLLSAAAGAIPAFILVALNRARFSHQEFLLYLIGTVMFCAGLAAQMHHSPLVAGLVCGVVTANFCRHRTRALTVVEHSERSFYIIMLLLIGASWKPHIDMSLVLMLVYFLSRVVGKVVGAFIGTRIFRPRFRAPRNLGLGLTAEGGLSMAIVVSFSLIHTFEIGNWLVTVIVFSVLLNDLLSPGLIVSLFGVEERKRDQ